MSDDHMLARVLWFNDAKGYGLVRAENVVIDDIRVDAHILQDAQELLRGTLVEIVCKEALTGLVVEKLSIIRDQ